MKEINTMIRKAVYKRVRKEEKRILLSIWINDVNKSIRVVSPEDDSILALCILC